MAGTIDSSWYDLFSRGARDWLRHNGKVRDAVQQHLPDLISSPDLITGPQERTVQVPVRMLEHARFKLATPRTETGAGQGAGQPGDILRSREPGGEEGEGGNEDGEVRLLLEFSIDEVMDWLWEEFQLPELKVRPAQQIDDIDLVREGWDRHGARSRLDRRRTVKEAIKRRAVQEDPVPFTNDDLRFRQVVARPRPSTSAVILFAIDVSASMTQAERKLAKAFFFFALQGIRRQYAKVETRFIAHTTHAWEFTEDEFFQVSGIGGTLASTAFGLVRDIVHRDYDPAIHNIYLFYASDGENFAEDRQPSSELLTDLAGALNCIGYVETLPGEPHAVESEMRRLCGELERRGLPVRRSLLTSHDDVWRALRSFFSEAPTAAPHEGRS